MKIFIICCLLFIHVNMCIFIRGFGFGDGFPPESVSGSGSGSGFDFGFRFWVHGDSTRSEPDPLPFLGGKHAAWQISMWGTFVPHQIWTFLYAGWLGLAGLHFASAFGQEARQMYGADLVWTNASSLISKNQRHRHFANTYKQNISGSLIVSGHT